MSDLRISNAAARRIGRLARKGKRPPQRILDAALETGLDYHEWFVEQVKKGVAELNAGKVLSHRSVLKELARRKAAFARALKKAA
jgi:predicted transcriptional regulator